MACLSCDTFVAMPPATKGSCIIFGKNSDRPREEVQEVVQVSAADHPQDTFVQCTYIKVKQAAHTFAAVLSKPSWIWGAEMGANEYGVCIGNEAVWSKEGSSLDEKLLGMDLVRLGLERAKTAMEAVDVITDLLDTYGQGGPCFEQPGMTEGTYENSFLIVDHTNAWILETAGKHWAAERISNGVRNISNLLSISTHIDKSCQCLRKNAEEKGYWTAAQGQFDFSDAYSSSPTLQVSEKESPTNRFRCGKKLLDNFAAGGGFDVRSMFSILRSKDGGICRVGEESTCISVTTASQVSVLPPIGSNVPACHWFTATPNPSCSVFKPFIFCSGADVGTTTRSPEYGNDPAKIQPRFQSQVDRQHPLYRAQQKISPLPGHDIPKETIDALLDLETSLVQHVEHSLNSCSSPEVPQMKLAFKDAVESEMSIYENLL